MKTFQTGTHQLAAVDIKNIAHKLLTFIKAVMNLLPSFSSHATAVKFHIGQCELIVNSVKGIGIKYAVGFIPGNPKLY